MKNLVQNIKENYKLVIGVFFAGILLGWLMFSSSDGTTTANQGSAGHEGHKQESARPETWTCSMHPQIKQNKPGSCPICGMDLIPLVSMAGSGDDVDPNEIVMTESAAKLADIQTMEVSKGIPHKTVFLQGKVQDDERNISELTARFGGRIEKLFVNFTGQNVAKGEKLATIYSPGLVTAQRELLEAISFKETYPSIYIAAKGKLKLWDLTDEQILAIEEKGEPQFYFDVLSPIKGTVTMRHVALGDYVKEGTALFRVVDLTRIWVMFDAYESDLPWIKLGDKVDFTIQALPGKNFSAKVSYIDPFINAVTRVTKVRVVVKNPKLTLKPEMFTTGLLESEIAGGMNKILIPKSSILWTGKRAVVYVKVPDRKTPSFLYREIILGPEAGAFFVVAEGLEEGEEIATNGVFKIDAASQLIGLPSMMNPGGGKVSTGHDHGGSQMSGEKMGATKGKSKKETYPEIKKEDVPKAFKQQLSTVLDKYIALKEAFVDTDEAGAGAQAKLVIDALDKVDMALLKGDAHKNWMKISKLLKDNLKGIVNMKGIEMKRSHFSIVSDNLVDAIKMYGIAVNKPVYIDYCSMANDNKGGYWLSYDKEIKNPYFGQMMLKCGEVKETIVAN